MLKQNHTLNFETITNFSIQFVLSDVIRLALTSGKNLAKIVMYYIEKALLIQQCVQFRDEMKKTRAIFKLARFEIDL